MDNILKHNLDDWMITVNEGGSGYWAHAKKWCDADNILQGKHFSVYDIVTNDKLGTFDYNNALRGLYMMSDRYPEHFSRLIEGTYDADDTDLWFQLSIMSEVIYG